MELKRLLKEMVEMNVVGKEGGEGEIFMISFFGIFLA